MNRALEIKTLSQIKRNRYRAHVTNFIAWGILIPASLGVTYLILTAITIIFII